MTQHDKLDRLLGVGVKAALNVHGRRARAVFTEGLAQLTRGLSQTGTLLESLLERLIAPLPVRPHASIRS